MPHPPSVIKANLRAASTWLKQAHAQLSDNRDDFHRDLVKVALGNIEHIMEEIGKPERSEAELEAAEARY